MSKNLLEWTTKIGWRSSTKQQNAFYFYGWERKKYSAVTNSDLAWVNQSKITALTSLIVWCTKQSDGPYSAHLTKFLTKINHPPIRVCEFYWLQSRLLTFNIVAWIVEICGRNDLVCKCFREMHHFVCFHINHIV